MPQLTVQKCSKFRIKINYCTQKIFYKMDATNFPPGNYYHIICKDNGEALKVHEKEHHLLHSSKVSHTKANPEQNDQIWMVEKVGKDSDTYEIVSCASGYVLEEDGKEIKMKLGKQSSNQLFAIEPAEVHDAHQYYWIKTDSKKGKEALELKNELHVDKFEPKNEKQQFLFQLATNSTIKNSSIIINNLSGKAIDIPKASTKEGEIIEQWDKNKRWNQRWIFEKHGEGVIIKSAFNGLVLDIAHKSKSNNAKVCQWKQHGKSNQIWIPEHVGNFGLVKFKSAHVPDHFLSVHKENLNDGGVIEVTKDDSPANLWKIQGPQP